MKINCSIPSARRRLQAMTLAEMMTSITIFTLLFAGMMSVSLFGMRQDELTNSKLGANDQASAQNSDTHARRDNQDAPGVNNANDVQDRPADAVEKRGDPA